MDSKSGAPSPLQFDTAVPPITSLTTGTAQAVTCAMCQCTIPDEYYDVNGQSVCGACRGQLALMVETPRNWGIFAKAALFGIGAAIAGAILYYAVIAITDFEIGIVAVAIGFMVGWSVRKGAGGGGGRRFQVLALALTYWAVGLAYTPVAFQQLGAEDQESQAETSAGATAPTPSEAEDSDVPVSLPLAIAVLFGISLALPVLAVVSSLPGGLISAAIIAFGMHQAWRMTGVPSLLTSGPYRIAAAASPSS